MQYTKEFKNLSSKDVEIAGGKGASLGEMTQAGIPVPNGFVILSNTFEKFIDEGNLSATIDAELDKINHEDINSIEKASKMIQDTILKTEILPDIVNSIKEEFKKLNTKFVAVRSSATSEDSADAAWAGQLDSFLNTTEKTLIENVRKCWASLFTPRAIFYRFEKKLHKEKISVAVVVQKMVNSEESGIAFSVHPVTQDRNQIIIEAGFGLGEAIVSGQITPDAYVIDKQDSHIIDISTNEQSKGLYKKPKGGNEWKELGEKGSKQVLTKKEILELSKVIIEIEDHYSFPVDIEWAREGGKIYIVQSRPITTLSEHNKHEKPKEPYIFHTSVSGFPLLMSELIFNNNTYGEVDYVMLYEKDISLWYLTEKGNSEAYELSKKLIDNNFFTKLFNESEKMDDFLKTYKGIPLNEKNIIKEWKSYVKLFHRFTKIYRFYEPPFQQAIEELVLKEISEKEIREYLVSHDQKIIENLSKEGKEAFNKLLKLADMKLILHEESAKFVSEHLMSFIEFVAKKNNISVEIVSSLREKEFVDAMNGKPINIDLAKEKMKGCALVKRNNTWHFDSGDKYLDLKKEIKKTQDKNISGNTAFPGKAKGKVVLYQSWTDTIELNEGDILVTGMTNPLMVPFIKKAGAIVTDEGGIICHAAIVSREMKKPCITGTKNATQLLKDGDIVEVDADKGIVRIIE